MRSLRSLPAAVVLAALAACGGEPPAEEAEMQPAVETAAAPTSCYIAGGTADEARARPSPLTEISFAVGGGQATLCYGAPSANGRQVMGALVPWGEPWRLGANEATAFHVTAATRIGSVELQPGSYSFYAIPGETEWTFVLNSVFERWGIPIDDAVRGTDLGTFTAAPEATAAPVEKLTFRFDATAGPSGELIMEWENTRLRIPVGPAAAAPAM